MSSKRPAKRREAGAASPRRFHDGYKILSARAPRLRRRWRMCMCRSCDQRNTCLSGALFQGHMLLVEGR
jgi:hypothetical protein